MPGHGLWAVHAQQLLGYAVDFDGDGVADIWNNPVDAIGSVANYFQRHGWRKGGRSWLAPQ